MFLVLFPRSNRVFVDRLPDLAGARCLDESLGLVEVENARLEWQFKELKHSSTLNVDIRNSIFIANVEDATREYRVPILHKFPVAIVVSAQRLKTVGISLLVIKWQTMNRKTVRDRVAMAMNKLRLWQR